MPAEIVIPGVSWPSGEVYTNSAMDLAVMATPGIRHYLNADNAVDEGDTISMRCKAQNILLQSTGTAPLIDAAIGGKPTLTHGTAGAGILSQSMRAVNADEMYFGEDPDDVEEFSFIAVTRLTRDLASAGVGNPSLLIGNVTGAGTSSSDRSPVIRFNDTGGSIENIPQFLQNALGVREFYNGLEFRNVNRILLVTFSLASGWHWYVDDYSTHKKASSSAVDALTDGRFLVGTVGAGFASQNYCGSWGMMAAVDVDLFNYNAERATLVKAVADEYGITSS